MNEQDFNKIKEISKELNNIRLRNNLQELQLTSDDRQITYYEYHKKWNEVTLITRGEHKYRDCKIASMTFNKETNDIIDDMEYVKYINYR